MENGSLIDHESQKIKNTVPSTAVAELCSFMDCFASCQSLQGLDTSGEVANIHMRIDVKNLVTTIRTIHLLEQKETIHLISMLRKKFWEVFMSLLTFQSKIAWQIASQRLQPRRTI